MSLQARDVSLRLDDYSLGMDREVFGIDLGLDLGFKGLRGFRAYDLGLRSKDLG